MEEGKKGEAAIDYGTFVSPLPCAHVVSIGLPQPVPPPCFSGVHPAAAAGVYPPRVTDVYRTQAAASGPPLLAHAHYPATSPYYSQGYQACPGGVALVAQGTPFKMERLPCCGLGIGWFLFVTGFFLAAIPWYAGALILLFSRTDYREKPGLIACIIAAVLAANAALMGLTKGVFPW
ncbi:hypothetical protein HPP92_023810 [Vanilla planifolia]|uniref:60S ribosomal protein L18a-like protein n=1 Tax=Vanilla planifolia TaxID=51239 RepID=A0A835PLI1_VANPL|nr:hypothetical protein HPP92_024180 [Vanilla planifolia]KAG0456022.1 hypothetical protein HPP92_023810 [Vanilla planifolia]